MILLAVGLVAAYVLYSVGGAVLLVIRGIHNPNTVPVPIPRPGQNINLLFLGLDAVINPVTGKVDLNAPLRGSYSRTDTMILLSVDPVTNEAAMISIPRDSRCLIPGRSWDKINHAHAYGGPALAMKSVEGLLGIDVHYYVRTNYHGVESVVNVLGGVDLFVEKDMHYLDPYQDLVIDLKKGQQTLDGDKSLQYLRYRNDGGDIARIGRQQKFIGALIRKVVSFGTVFRAQSLAREVIKYIDTNIPAGQVLEYAMLAARINDPSIEMATLPGEAKYVAGISYWVLDEEGTRDIVDRLVWRIDKEANAAITVRVLNGTSTPGLAAEMAARLRRDGFDVVEVTNAPARNHERTSVISHVGDKTVAESVARSVMRFAQDPEALQDTMREPAAQVTVIVGTDFPIAGR